ncbi:MAG: LTA synthase family protein, partial [Erysipelotrichia bacterium]|nr:LTA synthase family protein [Erysipelotrichia bacterium]
MGHNLNFFAIWKTLKSRLFAALALFAFIRVLFVLLNYQSLVGEYWRHSTSQSVWFNWIFAGLFVVVGYCMQRSCVNASPVFRSRFLLFLLVNYLLLGLFATQVGERSYFYLLVEGRMLFEDWQSLIVVDLFFQPPFLCWGLAWFALSFWFARRWKRENYLPALWCLPFVFLQYHINNFAIIFFLAAVCAGLWGFFFGRGNSSRQLFIFWGISYLFMLVSFASKPLFQADSAFVVTTLLAFFWFSGIWLIRQCEKENTMYSLAVSWFVPVVSFGGLHQTLSFVPLSRNLFDFWFIMASFHFAFYAVVAVLGVFIVSVCAGFVHKKLVVPVFYANLSLLAGFYCVDAVLAAKNGLRLNYDTLSWVAGLENIGSIVFTSLEIVQWWQILIPAVVLSVFFVLFVRYADLKIKKGVASASPTVTVAFLVSLISYIGMGFWGQQSYLLADPLKLLLASLPLADDTRLVSAEKLLDGFAECGVAINKDRDVASRSSQQKNLLLIMIESTANQYVSLFGHHEETWPRLAAYKDRMEIFPMFFSNFPESSNADFAVMSGIYPPPYLLLRENPNVPVQTFSEVLKAQNYDCQMYFSGLVGDTGLSLFYRPRGFSRLYDSTSLPGLKDEDGWLWGAKEYAVVDYVNRALDEKAQSTATQPFFIYYRNVFPHTPFLPQQQGYSAFSENDIIDNASLVGRFKNCLLYQDAQLARILEHLDKTGLSKNTYVAIVADHGTMLGEFGMFGHGWNLAPYLTNVPMLIITPEKKGVQINLNVGSQVDLLPTLLALINAEKPSKEFYQG